jgi:hypothetical protein
MPIDIYAIPMPVPPSYVPNPSEPKGRPPASATYRDGDKRDSRSLSLCFAATGQSESVLAFDGHDRIIEVS